MLANSMKKLGNIRGQYLQVRVIVYAGQGLGKGYARLLARQNSSQKAVSVR